MDFTLENFESFASSKINARGKSYFKSGAVHGLEELKEGIWRAEVEGTYPYTVEIRLDANQYIQFADCNCPYDYEAICKHIIAVLYELRKIINDGDSLAHEKPVPASGKKSKTKSNRRKTISQQIDDLMEQLPEEDMRIYLKEVLLKDKPLRSRFFLRFSPDERTLDKSSYKKHVRDILEPIKHQGQSYDPWNDFNSYTDTSPLMDLLDDAAEHIETGHYESAITLCQAVIEESVPSLQYVHDSDGGLWEVIETAFSLLHQVTDSNPDTETAQSLFDYCLKEHRNPMYNNWGFSDPHLEIAVELAAGSERMHRIEDLLLDDLQSLKAESDKYLRNEYKMEKIIKKLIGLYREEGKMTEIQALLNEHNHLPGIREQLIQQAWNAGDYDEVKKLAAGTRNDSDSFRGNTSQWTKWLLNAAEAEGDLKKQRKYTEELLLTTHNIDWYKALKKLYDKNEWKKQSDRLIEQLKNKNPRFHPAIIASIYIEEKQWENLWNFVCENPNLRNISKYDRWLKKHDFDALMNLYRDAILRYMEGHTGRKYYREVCGHFDRMKRLGGAAEAERLADRLKRTYSNRPAMLEEFKKAGF